jgi:hypothetical protein
MGQGFLKAEGPRLKLLVARLSGKKAHAIGQMAKLPRASQWREKQGIGVRYQHACRSLRYAPHASAGLSTIWNKEPTKLKTLFAAAMAAAALYANSANAMSYFYRMAGQKSSSTPSAKSCPTKPN